MTLRQFGFVRQANVIDSEQGIFGLNYMISSLIDGVIGLAFGMYLSLLGFGVIPVKNEESRRKRGTLMKVLGVLLVFFGIFNIMRGL